jgi:hypothetical protein
LGGLGVFFSSPFPPHSHKNHYKSATPLVV